MSNFRSAKAASSNSFTSEKGSGFSNFHFVDEHFTSSTALRRIFSLARKLDFNSVVVEEIKAKDCDLLKEENEALAIRDTEFHSSIVYLSLIHI